MVTDRQPNILAFVCNWCAYAGADLAGVSRQGFPASNIHPMCA
jgi:F420-non-reducing hydrogenase iron-sulfur subunit